MVRTGGRLAAALTLLLLATLGLAGCGEQEGAETATAPTSAASSPEETLPPGTPDCADVWQDGVKIPRSYQGCADAEGVFVERDVLGCSSGQRMVRYADRFYGVIGGTVHEATSPLDQDPDYRESIRSCRG